MKHIKLFEESIDEALSKDWNKDMNKNMAFLKKDLLEVVKKYKNRLDAESLFDTVDLVANILKNDI